MAGKGNVVSVELKNGIVLQGKLAQVDKYMNFNLYDLNVDIEKWPQFVTLSHQGHSEELLHQRIDSQVRSSASERSGHRAGRRSLQKSKRD